MQFDWKQQFKKFIAVYAAMFLLLAIISLIATRCGVENLPLSQINSKAFLFGFLYVIFSTLIKKKN